MLNISKISLSFGETVVLNGLTLEISNGETVGLIGPNGSGKTSMFNIICGFLNCQQGELSFKGVKLNPLAPYERARLGIGRVFQNFGIFKDMTVEDNVLLALESRKSFFRSILPFGKNTAVLRNQAREFLNEVGLGEKFASKAGVLSGGQLRLLEIARILAFGAELFLLDEPTAGVSPKMKGDVATMIKKLRELGKSIMVIEHDLNFIGELCDRILVLDSGKIAIDGEVEAVRSNPLLQEIYFGADHKK